MTKFKDVAHLYIGCMVQYPDTCGKKITARLTGVTISEIETTYKRKRKGCSGDILSWQPTASHNSDALHTKPILRPLSSMTKEEVAEFMGITDGVVTKGNYSKPFFQLEWKDNLDDWRFKFQYSNQLSAYQFIILLSKGFDLFGLIESGEAIDGTINQ
jgi:hypothetical protein